MINKKQIQTYFQQVGARAAYNPLRSREPQCGLALLLAITSLLFMVYIASEVTKDSAVEYIVNSQEMNRLKAYYAARNGMQIALLRVKIFQQVSQGSIPDSYAQYVDLVWKFPFAWPLPLPPDLNAVDKDLVEGATAESLMDTSYSHEISDEGSKIDINDLASASKTLREITKKQLLTLFEQQMNADDDFRDKYANTNFEEIVNRIADWMSDSTESADGSSDKRAAFSELGNEYPPNRGFRTLEEMRLVPGLDEELYRLLAGRVTIYGMKAINPNTASKEVLMSLDAGMTEEAVNEAIAKREDPQLGPFKGNNGSDPNAGGSCNEDFKNFVEGKGARLSEEFSKIPMICDKVFNFKITSVGWYGSGKLAPKKTITAYVMDLNRSASQIKTYLEKEKKEAEGSDGSTSGTDTSGGTDGTSPTGPSSGAPKQEPLPKGPPRVVYWTEF